MDKLDGWTGTSGGDCSRLALRVWLLGKPLNRRAVIEKLVGLETLNFHTGLEKLGKLDTSFSVRDKESNLAIKIGQLFREG